MQSTRACAHACAHLPSGDSERLLAAAVPVSVFIGSLLPMEISDDLLGGAIAPLLLPRVPVPLNVPRESVKGSLTAPVGDSGATAVVGSPRDVLARRWGLKLCVRWVRNRSPANLCHVQHRVKNVINLSASLNAKQKLAQSIANGAPGLM